MTRPASGAARPSSVIRRRSTYQLARWPEDKMTSRCTTAWLLIIPSRSSRSVTEPDPTRAVPAGAVLAVKPAHGDYVPDPRYMSRPALGAGNVSRRGKDGCRVDRCALFVDAGYVLADGAMAVHGTRHRDSVSWDYSGLLKFLSGLSGDRSGLPILRCYWYEATVEGRRTAEHDALADLPGLKLRLGRMRPGRREGIETEMHRDLTTLARNGAISDAVVVSAEEELAEVIAEVQDLGIRVILVHITVDGSWTISRLLRQESDDILEVGGAHLRPFVDLIAGAEPARRDEEYPAGAYAGRSLANGHGSVTGAVTHHGLPAAALPAPPTIYAAPVVAEYQRSAQPPAARPVPQDEQGPAR